MRAIDRFRLEYGIMTRMSPLKTKLDGEIDQVIGGTLQTDVGIVFGLTLYADTTDPANAAIPLITTTQSTNLWLTIGMGTTLVDQTIRLDDLLNNFAGTPVNRAEKFYPIEISYQDFALDVSKYSNPGLLTGPEIYINMWYITRKDMRLYKKWVDIQLCHLDRSHEEWAEYQKWLNEKSKPAIPTI